MIKDYIIPGILVGVLADIVKLIINYIGYISNFTSVVFWQIVASRFLDKPYLDKPIAYVIGGIADITVSALLGITFVYFIYVVGMKHLIIKGIGFGLAIWVGIFGTILGQSVQGKLPQTPSGILVTIVAHFIFGLTLALLTKRLQLNDTTEKMKLKRFSLTPIPALKIEPDKGENGGKKLKKPVATKKIKHW